MGSVVVDVLSAFRLASPFSCSTRHARPIAGPLRRGLILTVADGGADSLLQGQKSVTTSVHPLCSVWQLVKGDFFSDETLQVYQRAFFGRASEEDHQIGTEAFDQQHVPPFPCRSSPALTRPLRASPRVLRAGVRAASLAEQP